MNGWMRDFFHKNAYAILGAIIGLIVMVTMMRSDLQSSLNKINEMVPVVKSLEKSRDVQEEKNKNFEQTLIRIEGKLDRALRSR